MVAVFAPQLFLLVGTDLFLGASIATVILEKYFPSALPYIMDVGGFIGFIQLLIGPEYLNTFGDVMQFYYCVGFALIALMSLIGSNLYLLFLKRKSSLSSIFAITATIPASLIVLFFTSAYVNATPVLLPPVPVLPWSVVYIAFFGSASILVLMMILAVYNKKGSRIAEWEKK